MATIPSLAMIPSGYKDGTLYNPIPNTAAGDFSVSRGSLATRVNKEGLIETVGAFVGGELITNGDFATDSDWNKGVGWSIAGGVAVCDGTQAAASQLYQLQTFTINKLYRVTYTITVTAGSVSARLHLQGIQHLGLELVIVLWEQ